MVWEETWKLAMESLRANKLRAALTMLGVVIGSACIVLVVTVALAGKSFIIGQIEAVGSNIVYAELAHSDIGHTTALADEISLADLEAVKRGIPQVVEVAGSHDVPMTLLAGSTTRPVGLVGVTRGFQRIRNLEILQGRYFDEDDFASSSKVCLLNEPLVQRVFPDETPVGQTVHVGELAFTVIGVFRERVETHGESEITDSTVLVPFPVIQFYTGNNYIKTFYAQADSPENVPLVTQEVGEILKERHRPGVVYNVQNLSSFLQAARYISLAMTFVLLLVALIALLISGIGIMNIMLVSVTERTKEIGIRKAIGARRQEILYQFLTEASMISGCGAIAGILIAVLIRYSILAILRVVPDVGNIAIPISWLSVALAFLVSCATGVLFGYLPASRAAKLQPVESLHYE